MTTLTVVPVSAQMLKERHFERWLEDTEPEWFLEYLSPNREARTRYLMGRFESTLDSADGQVFLCLEGEQIRGAIALERMVWDSDYFDIKCGRVAALCIAKGLSSEQKKTLYADLFNKAKEWMKVNGVRLLQRRVLADRSEERDYLIDESVYHDQPIDQVDNMVTLSKKLPRDLPCFPFREVKPQLACRPAHQNDLQALIAMTRGAFPHSRFRQIDPVKGDALYVSWIENIVMERESPKSSGNVKTHVRVCSLAGEVIGYGAYHTDSKLDNLLDRRLGMLDLFVVSAPHRNQGVGRYLLEDIMEAMRMDGISDVEATTWYTKPEALVVYQKVGLNTIQAQIYTYHLWRN